MRPMYLCAVVGSVLPFAATCLPCVAQPRLAYTWGGAGPTGNTVLLTASPGYLFTAGGLPFLRVAPL